MDMSHGVPVELPYPGDLPGESKGPCCHLDPACVDWALGKVEYFHHVAFDLVLAFLVAFDLDKASPVVAFDLGRAFSEVASVLDVTFHEVASD